MGLLRRYQHHRALLLRLAFALGNLTTLSSAYRKQVGGSATGLCACIQGLGLLRGRRPRQQRRPGLWPRYGH